MQLAARAELRATSLNRINAQFATYVAAQADPQFRFVGLQPQTPRVSFGAFRPRVL